MVSRLSSSIPRGARACFPAKEEKNNTIKETGAMPKTEFLGSFTRIRLRDCVYRALTPTMCAGLCVCINVLYVHIYGCICICMCLCVRKEYFTYIPLCLRRVCALARVYAGKERRVDIYILKLSRAVIVAFAKLLVYALYPLQRNTCVLSAGERGRTPVYCAVMRTHASLTRKRARETHKKRMM